MDETMQNKAQGSQQQEQMNQQEQVKQFYAWQREFLIETISLLHKLKPNIEQEMMRTGELSRITDFAKGFYYPLITLSLPLKSLFMRFYNPFITLWLPFDDTLRGVKAFFIDILGVL